MGRHGYVGNECHNPSLGPNAADDVGCVGCHEGELALTQRVACAAIARELAAPTSLQGQGCLAQREMGS
jgi:hypothetical protein